LSNNTVIETSGNEEFDGAFDEWLEDSTADGTPDETTLEDTPNDETSDVADPDGSAEDTEEFTEDEESEETADSEDTEEEVDYAALYELERQRRLSFEGRIRAEKERKRAEETEPEEKKNKPFDLPDEVREMYPELAENLDALVQDRVKSALEPVKAKIKESEVDKHMQSIEAAHPDWEILVTSGELDTWASSLPPFMRTNIERVKASGTSDEVISMFDLYKRDRKSVTKTKPSKSTVSRKASDPDKAIVDKVLAALAVAKSPSKVETSPKSNDDDFDSAWDEFAK